MPSRISQEPESVPFSNVNYAHLEKMGAVKFEYSPASRTHILSALDTDRVFYDKDLSAFWESSAILNVQMVQRVFKVKDSLLSKLPARMITDQLLLLAIKFLSSSRKDGFASTLRFYHEVRLRTKNQFDDTISDAHVEWKNYTTVLIGKADYIVLSSAQNTNDVDTEESEMNIEDLLQAPVMLANSTTSTTAFGLRRCLLQICLVVTTTAEEDNALESHIPQVVAESIASIETIGKRFDAVRWCLTTGTKWIFGLTKALESEESKVAINGQYVYYTTEPLHMPPTQDISEIEANFKDIFRIFSYWIEEETPSILSNVFQGDSG